MTHPYKDLSDYHFWLKAVTYKVSGAIDPVITSLPINKFEKISTMGSCFAQHLSRSIQEVGFNYYVAESGGANYSEAEMVKRSFGVFSARYGNIYTIKQAIQLFDRAFDIDKFNENIWSLGSSYVDSFRPRIEPLGFASKEDLLQDRNIHLKCVRDVFINSDWIIFTLGLTEAWRSKVDGAIYPIAPGVFGGEFNELEHEFINFSVFDVLDDLRIFINKCRSINKNLKILLTVSPVPLAATYENRHVLSSTALSKAALLIAADIVAKEFENVIYFPSYEIITCPANEGRYFEDDLRQVTSIGVGHVMNIFSNHFLSSNISGENMPCTVISEKSEVICEEELINNAIKLGSI